MGGTVHFLADQKLLCGSDLGQKNACVTVTRLPPARRGEILRENPEGFQKLPSTSCVDHRDQLDPRHVAKLQGKVGTVVK